MGLISLVWEAFALVNSTVTHKMAVIFEDVKFMRATSMNKNQDVILTVSILKGQLMYKEKILEKLSRSFLKAFWQKSHRFFCVAHSLKVLEYLK